ncbi:MAG TPA: ATP-binding protein [Candidatus Binatia bacterium]|nr:ATP-binding protein [Candidatus Binatia bacterium]
MAGARTAERGRQAAEPAGHADLAALIGLLARALDLDRAALLLPTSPDGPLAVVVQHGAGGRKDAAFDFAAWTLSVPVTEAGMLVVHRRGDAPLDATDRALAERTAAGLARILDSDRLEADLQHTRELLARADRLSALGTLSAGVAHEIRNPLVSVRTFIQLLPERLGDEEFRTGFRDLALGEIERICGLINDLLAFSRAAPADREPTDLNDLAAQIARLIDAEARRRDVTVVCRPDPTLPLVVVNDAQVKQVLMNVILNAIQACPQHGRVEIATRTEDEAGRRWCAVVVSDSGTGIPPEHLQRIFEPFFSTKDAGSGLGLFIAHEIVAAHGGAIRAVPRPQGGTDFSILFPLEPRVADADAV